MITLKMGMKKFTPALWTVDDVYFHTIGAVRLPVSVCVPVCVCVFVHVSLCLCLCVCACLPASLCLCVRVNLLREECTLAPAADR